MGIAVRGTPVGSTTGAAAASLTVSFPPVAIDDILLFAIDVRGGTGTTITDPSGWTLIGTQQNSGTTLARKVYWKVATATEVSNGSVSVSFTSNKATAVCFTISGARATAPTSAEYSHQ